MRFGAATVGARRRSSKLRRSARSRSGTWRCPTTFDGSARTSCMSPMVGSERSASTRRRARRRSASTHRVPTFRRRRSSRSARRCSFDPIQPDGPTTREPAPSAVDFRGGRLFVSKRLAPPSSHSRAQPPVSTAPTRTFSPDEV